MSLGPLLILRRRERMGLHLRDKELRIILLDLTQVLVMSLIKKIKKREKRRQSYKKRS